MNQTFAPAFPLLSLVYVSSAVTCLREDEILDLLRVSRRNNERLGITGMLLYKDGNFMQVLEGPENAIANVSSKIKADPRHRGYIQLLSKPITETSFENWSMGFQNLNEIPAEDQKAFSPYLTDSLLDERFRSQPGMAYTLLRSFKRTIR